MLRKPNTVRCKNGLTLIEIMVAITVLVIAVIGTSGYRYYSALDSRKADAHIAAARIGLLLTESWRGVVGSENYDPVSHLGPDLAVTTDSGPDKPADFTILDSYKIVLNDVSYYTTLSWKDINVGLRALNIIVAWAPREHGEAEFEDADKLFELTTYVLTQ